LLLFSLMVRKTKRVEAKRSKKKRRQKKMKRRNLHAVNLTRCPIRCLTGTVVTLSRVRRASVASADTIAVIPCPTLSVIMEDYTDVIIMSVQLQVTLSWTSILLNMYTKLVHTLSSEDSGEER
jgi:hypothetical protein